MRARRDRAFQQRIYLIDTLWPDRNVADVTFAILGTKKDVYLVNFCGQGITCTCHDFVQRQHLCKHCLFVCLRVLKIPFEELVTYEDDGTVSESMLAALFRVAIAPAAEVRRDSIDLEDDAERIEYTREAVSLFHAQEAQVLSPPRPVRERKARPPKKARVEKATVEQRLPLDEPCAICFEDLVADKEEIVFCSYSCGKSLHADCFNRWIDKKEQATCVYCRANWF